MNRLIVLVFLAMSISAGFAQNRAIVRGKLLDSLDRSPLELVTVAAIDLKDSSLISYTLTTKDGSFTLRNLPAGKPVKFVMSYVGYQPLRRVLTLVKEQEVNLGTLALDRKIMDEIAITAERQPIVIKKDTIEFNAEAFKTRPNAVIEELLKKLPGIQVDMDGTITVNGKSVSKLTINGKEFFGTDPKIATRNLNADLVDKVQLLDDRENDPDHLIEDSKVQKIINIKLKKELRKSLFGKFYAGGGSRDRYESGALMNMFRDTLQVSFIGTANNLNRTSFTTNELNSQGGFGRSGTSTYSTGLATSGSSGMQEAMNGGVNINYDRGKKLKLNLLYLYNGIENTYAQASHSQQFLGDTTMLSDRQNDNLNDQDTHNISGIWAMNPSDTVNFRYTPRLSFTLADGTSQSTNRSSTNFKALVNESRNSGRSHANNTQFQHNLSYNWRSKAKKNSITINHSLSVNPNTVDSYSDNDNIFYTDEVLADSLRQLAARATKNTTAMIDGSYRVSLSKKITGSITAGGSYERNGQFVKTFNREPATGEYTSFQPQRSSDLDRYIFTYRAKPGVDIAFNKNISLTAGLGVQLQDITNQFGGKISDLERKDFSFLPSFRLAVKMVSISYDKAITQPNPYNLMPASNTDILNTFTGNPNLKPTTIHSANASYYKYFQQSQWNVNLSINNRFEQNSVVYQRNTNATGASSQTPVNRNGAFNSYFYGYLSKRFKKAHDRQLGLNSSFNGSVNRTAVLLNKESGFQKSFSMGVSQGATLSWKESLDVSASYNLNASVSSYTGVNYRNVTNTQHLLSTRLTARLPKKLLLETDYSYRYNPQVSGGFRKSSNMLNVALSLQMFKKDRGQLKLYGYDILDQNISVYRYSSQNSITDTDSKILKQYFMLSYVFTFNKIISK